jgi:single-strand DNA-binding protein
VTGVTPVTAWAQATQATPPTDDGTRKRTAFALRAEARTAFGRHTAATRRRYEKMGAEGLNRVMLIGNLGADPELRYTESGHARLSMRLATTERYVDRSGERKERTDWHTVILWGKRAEALAKLLYKGRTVHVEGRLQTRAWEDRDGAKRYTTEVTAHGLLLLDRGGGGVSGTNRHARGSAAAEDAQQGSSAGEVDDDLPF